MATYTMQVNYSRETTEFDARNNNHAIRRVVKTLGSRISYSRATVRLDGDIVAEISIPVQAHITINGTSYRRSDWFESFPG